MQHDETRVWGLGLIHEGEEEEAVHTSSYWARPTSPATWGKKPAYGVSKI